VCGANLREEFPERTIKELYKQFLIEAFSGADAAANQRLFNNLNRLALILGLEQGEIMAVHNEIGGMIIRNYVSKALKKGALGVEETNFLSSIKDALGMEQPVVDELVKDQQLNRVSVLIETMFEKDALLADDVREMRDTADLYDIDLVDDLQISQFKLERLFLCELEDVVDNDMVSADDMSAITEICEPLAISEEDAQRMLESTVSKRAASGLLQAAALLRQGASEAACTELTSMLKYAALLDITANAPSVSQNERNELYMLFQASQLTAGADADVADAAASEAKLDLLKKVMSLSGAPAQPA